MKNVLQFVAIIVAALIISSCGNKNVSEVKLIPVRSGKDFQYIDQEGKIVISPQFREASIFRNGLALVKTSSDEPKWGFISEDGKFAIMANYKAATVFSDDLAWVVSENAAPTAINDKGEIKVTLQDAETVCIFKEGLAAYSMVDSSGVKWGFVDKLGKVKINPQFSNSGNFSDGKCAVENNEGKWGYIDQEGKIIINYQFDKAKDFINGKAVVASGGKFGVIDNNGKYVINPQFSDMLNDGNNYLIEQDGKWGWCDKEGKITINPQFGIAYPFLGNDLAAVQSGEKYGYIDIDGKIAINPQFDIALPYNGKLALVQSSSKIGFIDKEGKYVINPQFDDVSRDLVVYMLNGSSIYESVETDFFNINAIISILNFDAPEGFTFNSTFEDIKTKYKIDENSFSKYNTENEVLRSKKITNDASYSFYVIGNSFDKIRVQRSNGWYTYYDTEYKFNGQAKPNAYAYSISLTGKGYGKDSIVISSILGKLSGYKKDENKSSENDYYYSDGKKVIRLLENSRNLIIIISNETSQGTANNEQTEESVD